MRISELFTVPKGKKITEKMMARVLVSSIGSILLCMACLASTTWAWFAVSIENPGNEIQISSVTITEQINNIARDPKKSYDLPKGTYEVKASVTNNATESQRPVYVNMMVAYKSTAEPDRVIRSECYSFKFEYRQSLKTWEQDKIIAEIDVVEGCFATVSFWPSWTGQSEHIYEGDAKAEIKSPDGITGEEPAEPPTEVETTASTDPATDPTNDAGTTPSTEGTTEPDETVTPTTEAPSDATTAPTTEVVTEEPASTESVD